MDAIQLFLLEHARAHSRAMASANGSANGDVSFEDVIFGGLTDEQLRRRPQPGINSLAWLLWHMARSEDMAVNILIAGQPQLIEEGGWMEKLGLSRVDIGTGMSDDEVSAFTATVDIDAIRSYRAAVGRRTREVVSALRPEQLEEAIDGQYLERAFAEGAIGPGGEWLRGFIRGKTTEFILCHVGTRHNFIHIGEAMCVRGLLGVALPT